MTGPYGWHPDLPDHRDHLYAAPAEALTNLPAGYSLRPGMPPVYDQGQIGSCTANAIAAAVEYDLGAEHTAVFAPSRLFIYYNERMLEHTVDQDSGARIRDGIKTVARQGVCPETLWPYDTSQFTQQPAAGCYTAALDHRVTAYHRITRNLTQLRGALAAGRPFVAGISVFESFESDDVAKTGTVPMPGWWEQLLGGHAILIVGYDDQQQQFTFRNSWGDSWGDGGYGTLPYPYLLDSGLSTDFWTLTTVQG